MICKPCAKINLGLNIVGKRPDGYHNLETVFYPIPLCDILEVNIADDGLNDDKPYSLTTKGIVIDGDDSKNLVVRAYMMMRERFHLPYIHIILNKNIPTGAGMGGGSSDCAFMIRLLNKMFGLNMSTKEMIGYAASLGADCAFFIMSEPAYATGIGDILTPVTLNLGGYHILIVKPDIHISTAEAFKDIAPGVPEKGISKIICQSINTWKTEMVNDFEKNIFENHPEIAGIKKRLYDMGAVYAAMSGSGSAVFGIFKQQTDKMDDCFKSYFHTMIRL